MNCQRQIKIATPGRKVNTKKNIVHKHKAWHEEKMLTFVSSLRFYRAAKLVEKAAITGS